MRDVVLKVWVTTKGIVSLTFSENLYYMIDTMCPNINVVVFVMNIWPAGFVFIIMNINLDKI